MSAATSEVVWLHRLLSDLGVHLTAATPFHCDNNGASQIATNPVVNERTNNKRSGFTLIYILMKSRALHSREVLGLKDGALGFALNEQGLQIADLFTKSHTRARHEFLVGKLSLLDLSFVRV